MADEDRRGMMEPSKQQDAEDGEGVEVMELMSVASSSSDASRSHPPNNTSSNNNDEDESEENNENEDNSPEVNRWTCDACGCHTNTEEENPISCGICGTNRLPLQQRILGSSSSGIPRLSASRFGFRLANAHAALQGDDDHNGGTVILRYGIANDDDGNEEDDDEEEDQERIVFDHEEEEEEDDPMNEEEEERGSFLEDHEEDDGSSNCSGVLSRAKTDEEEPDVKPSKRKKSKKAQNFFSRTEADKLLALAVAAVQENEREKSNGSGDSQSILWDGDQKGSLITLLDDSDENSTSSSEDKKIDAQNEDELDNGKSDKISPASCSKASIAALSRKNSKGHGPLKSIEEGQSVRATRCLPKKGLFGWKVTFDSFSSPSTSFVSGNSLGGRNLVGVAPGSFDKFSDRSGLQNSRLFWGIEDGGRQYEGSKKRPLKNRLHASHSDNGNSRIFGNCEVVTIVADMDKRRLMYWCDGKYLGVLAENLPADQTLYPIAVPYNVGTGVAISSLNDDPIEIMMNYREGLACVQKRRDLKRRSQVKKRKLKYLNQYDLLTDEASDLLHRICGWYSDTLESFENDGVNFYELSYSGATRLWYRCGISLSSLDEIIDKRLNTDCFISSHDFVKVVQKIINDEMRNSLAAREDNSDDDIFCSVSDLKIGDSIEVLKDDVESSPFHSLSEYNGLQQSGARGVVSGIAENSLSKPITSLNFMLDGKQSSCKAKHIATERSGLIDCAAIKFIVDILHRHGYDPNMKPFWGHKIDLNILRVGDLVVDKRCSLSFEKKNAGNESNFTKFNNVGRFYPKFGFINDNLLTLPVQYPNRECKVLKKELLHTTFHHGNTILKCHGVSDQEVEVETSSTNLDGNDLPVHPDVQKKVSAVRKLDCSAIESLMQSCEEKSTLRSLYNADLASAIIDGIKLSCDKEQNTDGLDYLIGLGKKFICAMLGKGIAKSNKSRSTLFRSKTKKSEGEIVSQVEDAMSGLHPFLMERLFSSTLRDERTSLNIRDALRDIGSGSRERQRNVLLALMANSQSEREESLQQLAQGNLSGGNDEDDDNITSSRLDANDNARNSLNSRRNVLRSSNHFLRLSSNAATASLISNGLLLDDLVWVKKSIRNGLDCKGLDVEGCSILLLAVKMGCRLSIIQELINGGAQVSHSELEYAAQKNQKDILEYLLRHTVYVDGSFSKEKLSKEVLDILTAASDRQILDDRKMRSYALSFSQELFVQVISHMLFYHRKHNVSKCELFKRILVGDLLLDAIVESQGVDFDDTDDESNDVRNSIENTSDMIHNKSTLLHIVFFESDCSKMFEEDQVLRKFLFLIESHLWSKELNDIAVGITLLCNMIKSVPNLCKNIGRFGFKEVIQEHKVRADMVISDHSISGISEKESFCIKCPKNHKAIVHLTKHSQFRCDLCGKGVKQGRPMHGCRKCDWDACEKCTDQAEGGIVKWRFINSMINEFSKLYENIEGKQSYTQTGDKVYDIAYDIAFGLKAYNLESMKKLSKNLNSSSGNISLYEFKTHILPALFSALLGNDQTSKSDCSQGNRFKKKARFEVSSDLFSVSNTCEKRKTFTKILMSSLFDDSYLTSSRFDTKTVSPKVDSSEEEEEADLMDLDSVEDNNTSKKQGVQLKTPELIRYIHAILSFDENVRVDKSDLLPDDGMLQALKLPFAIRLHRTTEFENNIEPETCCNDLNGSAIYIEPLMPIGELKRHILRCCNIRIPEYVEYCRSLVSDRAIIAERPLSTFNILEEENYFNIKPEGRKIARIISFCENTGAHTVRYASHFIPVTDNFDGNDTVSDQLEFDAEEVKIVLAARDYCILYRNVQQVRDNEPLTIKSEKTTLLQSEDFLCGGNRVESNIENDDKWLVYTIISSSTLNKTTDSRSHDQDKLNQLTYNIVSDTGIVYMNVPDKRIRCHNKVLLSHQRKDTNISVSTRARNGGIENGRIFQNGTAIASLRRVASSSRGDQNAIGVLRRSWSALSLLNSMKPLDLSVQDAKNVHKNRGRQRKMSIGGSDVDINMSAVELQPKIFVELSLDEDLMPISSEDDDATLYSALQRLYKRKKRKSCERLERNCACFYNISFAKKDIKLNSWDTKSVHRNDIQLDYRDDSLLDCDGLNATCVMCLKLLNTFAHEARNYALNNYEIMSKGKSFLQKDSYEGFHRLLASRSLTEKLLEQLENPLSTVSGCLPRWCRLAPAASPHVFSHSARRRLLERTTFGVSRAALRQQEAKVDVGNLRERMAALRGRAVALVGEAFSGGASDPTALQLQADELYGMEEALAARVAVAFKAQKWDEHSLECAKAAVRRTDLLSDAATIMELFASDVKARRRRLEVRFEGESGFDAAAGSEAGVTRGFYADVAEALLRCNNVSDLMTRANNTDIQKLPLWIPDTDSTETVVIPTPRADAHSDLGVYPRPIGPTNPNYGAVLDRFRFIGRLFAAAFRDNFVFSLPLSASFLKLVQNVRSDSFNNQSLKHPHGMSSLSVGSSSSVSAASDSSLSLEDHIHVSNAPSVHGSLEFKKAPSGMPSMECVKNLGMNSLDLPRPGFLGGDIFAVETHICSAIEKLEKDETLSHSKRSKLLHEIATDPSFAKKALGKNYDCSFEQYMDGRIFVDPIDPCQNETSHPLCKNFDRAVTIFNVKEWVYLAKKFFLYDGVIEQAKAFRQGVDDFFSAESLKLFTPYELQRDACGSGDNVDSWDDKSVRDLLKLDGGKGTAEALLAVAAMGGEGGAALSRRFGPNSPTIGYLVKMLLEANSTERRQFLTFVTSVPIVTPGKIEVVPIVSPSGDFLPMKDPTCLPRANTCTRRLYLPKFESYQSFSNVLWAIVKEESKFKGFFEWRG